MNSDNKADDERTNSNNSAPSVVTQRDNAPETERATAQQFQEVEERMSAFERSTVRWTRVAVSVSILAAIFICAQWYEMHSGSSDTHDLAVAAENQAAQTKLLAERALDQAKALDKLSRQTGRSADAAKTAAEIAELSERPWIKILGLKTLGNNDLIPALSFQGFGHGPFPHVSSRAVTFQTKFSVKNVGHSVAEILDRHELYLPLWGNGEKFEDNILAEQRRFCDKSQPIESNLPWGVILFPDEVSELGGGAMAPVTPERVDHLRQINPADSFPPIIKKNQNGYVIPVVIVCIDYRLAGSANKTYQTRAVFEIIRKDDRTRFFDVGVDSKERDIEVIRNQLGDAAY